MPGILVVRNQQPWRAEPTDWPIAVHGATSYQIEALAVHILTEEFTAGQSILIIAGQASPIMRFQSGTGAIPDGGGYRSISAIKSVPLTRHQFISIKHSSPKFIIDALRKITDLDNRLISIFTNRITLSPGLWDLIKNSKRLMVIGDFHNFPDWLNQDIFVTKICYTEAPKNWQVIRPKIPPYMAVTNRPANQQIYLSE